MSLLEYVNNILWKPLFFFIQSVTIWEETESKKNIRHYEMFKNSNTKKSNIRSHLAAMKVFIEKLLLKFNSPLERKNFFFLL